MSRNNIDSLSQALKRSLRFKVETIGDGIVEECFNIYKKNILNRKGWARKSFSRPTTGDLDLENAPSGSKTGEGYSIVQAIEIDLAEQAMQFDGNAGFSKFEIGNIDKLFQMSPRWIYYEYGTLNKQEDTGSLNIPSFNQWENPYVPWSALRQARPDAEWGFRKLKGVGRFRMGVMMPLPIKGAVKNKPIPPLRMYRGSGQVSKHEIIKSQNRILKTALMRKY